MGIIFIFSKVPTARTTINETHKDQLKAVLTIMKRKNTTFREWYKGPRYLWVWKWREMMNENALRVKGCKAKVFWFIFVLIQWCHEMNSIMNIRAINHSHSFNSTLKRIQSKVNHKTNSKFECTGTQ